MSNFGSKKPGSSAVFLLDQIQKKAIDPSELTSHYKKICVRYLLMDRKYTMQEIGTLLKIPTSTLYYYRTRIMEQNAFMVSDLDERKVAVDIITAGETASARLFRKGKEKEAFEVLVASVEILQSLGYIKKRPIEIQSDNLTLAEILKYATALEQESPGLFKGANHRFAENGN